MTRTGSLPSRNSQSLGKGYFQNTGTPCAQPQHEPPAPRETLPPQPDKDKTVARRIPRLRAVVESQAFKNVLVDEMDMMLSRAATLIQASWRGYRLRQKLISQMLAAKAIQEAWRQFNTRRLLRSGKTVQKTAEVEGGSIPYHPPQQVRFQHPEDSRSSLAQPIMLNKETQFPSSDSLASYTHQLALLQSKVTSQPGVRATAAVGDPSAPFLPHQMVSFGLPCPVSLDTKCQPCLLARTIRSTCVVHVEGDTMKTKQGHPPAETIAAPAQPHPATRPSKAQSQAHLPIKVTKAQSQAHLATGAIKVQSQAHLPTGLTKAQSQAQLVTETAKCLLGVRQGAELSSKTQSQPFLVGFKASTQPCQHSILCNLPRAKPEDRLAQGYVQGKATQCPRQGASETQSVLVPLLASAGHTPCNVDSWGDGGAARAQPSTTSPAPPCQEEPADAGVSRGQAWNSTMVPGGVWEPSRGTVPWEATGRKAAAEPSQPGELVASVQAVEKMVIRAVVIIQACTRGYLVRRAIKVWHQWAVIIQAAWRGYCVRRDMIQLCRAATIIQASWRGFRVRRSHAQQMLLPAVWAVLGGGGGGGGARSSSDHRCFQSCQPRACSLCQSLSSGLGSPPSVVMLVGSSPRTCHTCGHTLPTRVVQGTGRGAVVQASTPRGCSVRPTFRTARQPPRRSQAATTIQSAWRGFRVRRQLKQQQVAAKMLQASWRGHCTRASLTTDALLGPAAWDNSRHTQWPGV
uniref:IQ domain-containing protein N n=1 Tax=Catagonus wagneri TaxID=51154 RepID=A0A8C3YMR6_9CETA